MVFGSKIVGIILLVAYVSGGADLTIGISHALEDFKCNDVVCGSLEVIGSVSSVLV